MFARIFGWSASVRRTFGLGSFLLALVGGALAIWAAVQSDASVIIRVLHGIMGLGAMIAGRRIYRSSQGLLFPRARMKAAAILCVVLGAILFLAGLGTPGVLVIAAGLIGFVGASI